MEKITLYHGSSNRITKINNNPMYFTPNIKTAKEYALGLNDCGEYSKKSYIYKIEIDPSEAVIEDDFLYFDGMSMDREMPDMVYNPESDYYCIKKVNKLQFVESYSNNL